MAFQMVDVAGKAPTRRRAQASGALRMGRPAFALLKAGRLPKGDALALGEAAGLLGAKRASETIPLCHPLPLDSVSVAFTLDASLPGVRARCAASAFAKTGVEMEALAGVTAALLAVYDLVKQVDAALTITDVRLDIKEGGKSRHWRHPELEVERSEGKRRERKPKPAKLGRAVVVTVSDRCSRGQAKDISGPILVAGLKEMGFTVKPPLVVADEPAQIEKNVRLLAKKNRLILLAGGTGLSQRDITPETIASLCDRIIPGIGEALRAAGARSTPNAVLSRSLAGQLGNCLVICLPGSAGGARDGLDVLRPLLSHALHVVDGGDHR